MDLSTSVDYPEVYPVVTPNLVLKAALGLPLGEPLFGHPDDSEVEDTWVEEDLATDTVPVPVLGGKRLRGSSDYSPTGIFDSFAKRLDEGHPVLSLPSLDADESDVDTDDEDFLVLRAMDETVRLSDEPFVVVEEVEVDVIYPEELRIIDDLDFEENGEATLALVEETPVSIDIDQNPHSFFEEVSGRVLSDLLWIAQLVSQHAREINEGSVDLVRKEVSSFVSRAIPLLMTNDFYSDSSLNDLADFYALERVGVGTAGNFGELAETLRGYIAEETPNKWKLLADGEFLTVTTEGQPLS